MAQLDEVVPESVPPAAAVARPAVDKPIAVLAVIGAQAIWASNNVVAKPLLAETAAPVIAVLRFSLAALLIFGPLFLIYHRAGHKLTRRDLWPLLVMGVAGQAVANTLFYPGLRYIPANDAGLLQITIPVWTLLLAFPVLGERPTALRWLGTALALIGAALLVVGHGLSGGQGANIWLGGLCVLGASMCWALYSLAGKSLLRRHPPGFVAAAINLVATAAIWPLSLPLGAWGELGSVTRWPPGFWLIMAYIVVVVAAANQWLYTFGLRRLEASVAAAFFYLGPLFTALMAAAWLGERPDACSSSAAC